MLCLNPLLFDQKLTARLASLPGVTGSSWKFVWYSRAYSAAKKAARTGDWGLELVLINRRH